MTLDFTIDAPVYADPNRERDYTLSTFRIVIEPPNWNVDAPLIVLQADDVEEEEDFETHHVFVVASSPDRFYDGAVVNPVASTSVTIEDNDDAEITLTKTLVVCVEAGNTTYGVSVTSRPIQDVTITVGPRPPVVGGTVGNAGLSYTDITVTTKLFGAECLDGTCGGPTSSEELGVHLTTIVFTPDEWNIPRTVAVDCVDDLNEEDDLELHIIDMVTASNDHFYQGRDKNITVFLSDNDDRDVVISLPNITVEESGAARYQVVLNSQPLAPVFVAITLPSTRDLKSSLAELTFTSTNYLIPQTMTIYGFDDDYDEPIEEHQVFHNSRSDDRWYDEAQTGIEVKPINVTLIDNDHAGITIVAYRGVVGTMAVPEGYSAILGIRLNSHPYCPRKYRNHVGDMVAGGVGGCDTSQVNVTLMRPAHAHEDLKLVRHEVPGNGALALSPGIRVGRSWTARHYGAIYDTTPRDSIKSKCAGKNGNQANVVFNPSNWSVPLFFEALACNDWTQELIKRETFRLVFNSTSADLKYDDRPQTSGYFDVTVVDIDAAKIFFEPTTFQIAEGGQSQIYTVRLGTAPAELVTCFIEDVAAINLDAWEKGFCAKKKRILERYGLNTTKALQAAGDALGFGQRDLCKEREDRIQGGGVVVTSSGVDLGNATNATDPADAAAALEVDSGGIRSDGTIMRTTKLRIVPNFLTYSVDNFADDRIVNVSAADDDFDDAFGGQRASYLVHTCTSNDTLYNLLYDRVYVNISEDDTADIFMEGPDVILVGEGAGTASVSFHMNTEPHYPVSVRLQTDCFDIPEFGKHSGKVRRKLMVDGVPKLDVSTPIPLDLWRGGFSIEMWAVDNLWYEGELQCRVWFTTDTQDLNYRATRMTIKPRASIQVIIEDNDSALFKMRTANTIGTWGSLAVFAASSLTGFCYVATVVYRAAQAVPVDMGAGGEYKGEYRVPVSALQKLTPPSMAGAWYLIVYAQLMAVSGKLTLVQKTAIVYQWIASRLDWTCFWFTLPPFIDEMMPVVEEIEGFEIQSLGSSAAKVILFTQNMVYSIIAVGVFMFMRVVVIRVGCFLIKQKMLKIENAFLNRRRIKVLAGGRVDVDTYSKDRTGAANQKQKNLQASCAAKIDCLKHALPATTWAFAICLLAFQGSAVTTFSIMGAGMSMEGGGLTVFMGVVTTLFIPLHFCFRVTKFLFNSLNRRRGKRAFFVPPDPDYIIKRLKKDFAKIIRQRKRAERARRDKFAAYLLPLLHGTSSGILCKPTT